MFKQITITFGTPSAETAKDMVFGRENLAEKLWGCLREGSVRLLSERRMGKTWLLMLTIASHPDWALPLFFDAEGCSTASEFIWKLNAALHESHLVDTKWWDNIADWFRRMAQQVQGKQIVGAEIPVLDPWHALLESTCRHMTEKAGEKKVVIVFDELPFFLDKLIKTGQGEDAIRFLDNLRQLRQALPNLRMVFCGSLGLHLVLDALKQQGYTGRPVNDMPPFDVPPLDPEMATQLAGGLLVGEGVECKDLERSAKAVAEAACGVPFYVQHLVKWMRDQREDCWTVKLIKRVPEELFEGAGDPAEFQYYDQRISQYYPEDITERARAALDMLSRNPKGESLDNLLNLVRHQPKTMMIDSREFLRVMEVLRDDHYVVLEGKVWRFKLEIVRCWWLAHRGGLTA